MNDYSDVLERCFYNYRAEWLEESLGDLFVRPPYYDKLESARPCLLIGGRGTGKTTALRSLRFGSQPEPAADAKGGHLGVYVRINKNQVHAFSSDLHSHVLRKAFAHYINLLISAEYCRLSQWLRQTYRNTLAEEDVCALSKILCIPNPTTDLDTLATAIQEATRALEVFVNNIDQEHSRPPQFSIAEAPVSSFARAIHAQDPHARHIFVCIDEYENLLETQQAAVNAYVKHAQPPLSYKLGMKTNGLHTRDTLDSGDPLVTPADYVEIVIHEEADDKFFREVIQKRLNVARSGGVPLPESVDELLPALSWEEEAGLLGAKEVAEEVRRDLRTSTSPQLKQWEASRSDGELYFLAYQAEAKHAPVLTLAEDWRANPTTWSNMLNNHGFASLFWLSRGRKGARIRKYYCGTNTLLLLARGNVRFFLELVGFGLREAEKGTEGTAVLRVTPTQQTNAARAVGHRQIDQLDGLGPRGGELKRLTLGIGKIFFELTRQPLGRIPEPTSFSLTGEASAVNSIDTLLREGVVHLAFEATPKTKLTSENEIRDDEYRLHPVLAPFFEMSYRRKRRINLRADLLALLQTNPRKALSEMLGIPQTPADALPEQLTFFSGFYM